MALMRSIALMLCLAAGALRAEPATPHLELQASRDFGYTLGSLIEHRLRLWLPDGAELVTPLLPSPGAINDWLDLRALHWEQESRHVVRIDVTYQVFKGVRDPETAVIPPLAIAYRAGGTQAEIHTPEWPFGLIPLIPPTTPDDKVMLRADAHERQFPAESAFHRFVAFLSAAALGALALAFRFGLIPGLGRRRPFAEACRRIARLRSASPAVRLDGGLRAVHEALARTHGTPVFPAMLDAFFEARPVFAPLRAEFEAFFDASQRHFFEPGAEEADASARWQALEGFCRRCARLERGA